MKVALVLLVASVLVSRSAGNPVGDTRDAKQFGGAVYNGGIGQQNQCAGAGACDLGNSGKNSDKKTPSNLGSTVYNGNIKQQNNCATTGSCHGQGKKKRSIKDVLRSIVPQLNTEASRQPKQFEGATYNGAVGEINGPISGPGFEGQTFNGPVGVVNGADQPSGDDFQFPQSLPCNCPDQSRPGSWICIKDEPQCQCQCKPFAFMNHHRS